ncbi:MAG: DUF5665 domain-containing protein [Alphaproteobacteria bacterium]
MKQEKLTKKEKITQLEKLADRLERMRFGDYVTNLNKTSRLIWLNLVAGISRGVGLTVGATLVIAIIFKIISVVVSMNVPYLSPMFQEIKQTLESRYNPVRKPLPVTQTKGVQDEAGTN